MTAEMVLSFGVVLIGIALLAGVAFLFSGGTEGVEVRRRRQSYQGLMRDAGHSPRTARRLARERYP